MDRIELIKDLFWFPHIVIAYMLCHHSMQKSLNLDQNHLPKRFSLFKNGNLNFTFEPIMGAGTAGALLSDTGLNIK